MPDAPLLKVKDLEAFYGDSQALYGIDLELRVGQIVAIIGANGAGKSTLLNAIAGLVTVKPDGIVLADEPIGGWPPYEIVARGVALVPEGRRLFASLTVEENLIVGAKVGRRGQWNLERVYQLFPILAERRTYPVMQLSGGQQQMVAIGRALMSNPRILLCDELSLGLAPIVIRDIYAQFQRIMANDMAAIIVEQDIQQALKIADYIYCILEGRIVLEGIATSLTREMIAGAYFGI
jgi:branched-chain amino acid transport system ATP-binding protein